MEVQVNVAADGGEPAAGKPTTYGDGINTWHNIRRPKDADSKPTWKNYTMGYSFQEHAEAIGMTGWDFEALRSRYGAYDVDSIVGHAEGVGITEEALARIREAAPPYVEVRRSTGGAGLHLYIYFDAAGIPCENHNIHRVLAYCLLKKLAADIGFDIAADVDCYGAVLWIWSRRASAEKRSFEILKPATQTLSGSDLPADWRDTVIPRRKKKEPTTATTTTAATTTPRVLTGPVRKAIVAAFIAAQADFGFLEGGCGWSRSGPNFQRPGGTKPISGSICEAKDGTPLFHCFTSSTNLEKDKSYNPYDLYRILKHGGDADAALATLRAQGYGRLRIPLLTCEQLDTTKYAVRYHVDGTLCVDQPCILGGSKKTLKTSLLIELLISVVTGKPFLGRLEILYSCPAIILSGESGLAVLQETARRIATAKGLQLSKIQGLFWSEWLPNLDDEQHLDALDCMLETTQAGIVALDPAYLCMNGADAANLFAQGALLRRVSEVCQRHGATLIICHHTRKRGKIQNQNTFDPIELDDVAWAGFAEWARQWILLGRREEFEPGSGQHQLWMSVGGSAGHSALWALDVDEGTTTPRTWKTSLSSADTARENKKCGSIRDRLLQAAREYPDGETKSVLLTTAKLRTDASNRSVFDHLVSGGDLVACTVAKHGVGYPGYKLATAA
jgi:hypothetical protein